MRKLKTLTQGLAAAALALGMTTAMAADKPTLTFGFVNGWDDSVATSYLAAEIIESKLGYDVELKPLEPAIMWQGVGRGDIDGLLSAWLPVTHGEYLTKVQDKIEILGTNYNDAKIGLVVPDYVEAKSIDDLNKTKDAYGGKITGIDAGAGVMRRTEEAVEKYGLDFKLMPSSGPAMATALARAIKKNEAIVVPGWVPHWMFAKWKLRFLEDPKGVYGDAERVDTVVHPSLNTKAPEAVAFLKKFSWTSEEIGSVMLAIRDGAKPEDAAKDWVAKNPERVDSWLK
ncbi:glycine betaine ABC transporter substrate-binding protein [Pseudomonas benzenivorans]|uniref:Glycine betaine ABC transporter substrate-binding protein n=1 Tax=Pseudomonas benzenivorans TaxID=556533 RepID=A0ABZ0PWG4_9PSED|nr:glycine betaine ABC transporter substrate-binding protein [Pseudomonas benzenivorans]WPC04824.1 glycine betaine ABC transporter substrate-binding protein [Pseudomonas benzenivorans]